MTEDERVDPLPEGPVHTDLEERLPLDDTDPTREPAVGRGSAAHERQDPDHVGVDWELTPHTHD